MTTYPIGTRFKTRGKRQRECMVVDIWRTYNAAGELVKTRYVCQHKIMGQTITDHDVVGATIAMGFIL